MAYATEHHTAGGRGPLPSHYYSAEKRILCVKDNTKYCGLKLHPFTHGDFSCDCPCNMNSKLKSMQIRRISTQLMFIQTFINRLLSDSVLLFQ